MRQKFTPVPLALPIAKLARAAGAVIMQAYANAQQTVSRKADDSPLTAADLAAHRCLVCGLAALRPTLPVVSEEDAASWVHRRPTGRYWLIDPLDGTKEFLARNGEFTVDIALIQDGEAVSGAIYAPALALLYWGGRRRHRSDRTTAALWQTDVAQSGIRGGGSTRADSRVTDGAKSPPRRLPVLARGQTPSREPASQGRLCRHQGRPSWVSSAGWTISIQ